MPLCALNDAQIFCIVYSDTTKYYIFAMFLYSCQLQMYDGPTAEDNLIDEFICGQDHMRRIVSSSSTLSIYFKQYVEGPGVFNATYSQVKGRTFHK